MPHGENTAWQCRVPVMQLKWYASLREQQSKVCDSIEPKVSVPIIASVLKSHTKNGELRLEPQEWYYTRWAS